MNHSARKNATIVFALALCAIGCATEQPISPQRLRVLSPQAATHDEYPDSSQMPPEGSAAVSQSSGGLFYNSDSTWTSWAWIDLYFVTDANYLLTSYVKKNLDGSTLNSGPTSNTKPDKSLWLSHHYQDSVVISTLHHTCGVTGSSTLHVAAGAHYNVGGVDVLDFSYDKQTKAQDVVLPDCPNPKARAMLSYGDYSGNDLYLTVPEGSGANISMTSASEKGSDGSTDIVTYAWSVGGSGVSSSASTSHYFAAGNTVSLMVTDQDNHSNTASGVVDLSYFDPCDDPLTDEVETCEDNPGGGGEVSVDGSASEPGDWLVPIVTGTYVCYYTDWYENGVYTNETDLDYCDVE